jgi:hypothetical protein
MVFLICMSIEFARSTKVGEVTCSVFDELSLSLCERERVSE